jgi:hypothetical protein
MMEAVVRLANVCGNPAEGAVLRRRPALPTMRGDHLDAIALGQISIRAVAVIGFVVNQSRREGEAVSEGSFDELAFVRRSAFDTNGDRETVIVGDSDDFRSLAAFGGPDRKAPFLPRSVATCAICAEDQAAKFASVSARTSVPRTISSGDAYSSGR